MSELIAGVTRRSDWAARLTRHMSEMLRLSRKGELKFDWEHVSCAWFVASAVEEMTGTNFYEPYDEEVDSALAAASALVRRGYGSLADAVDAVLPVKPLSMTTRGDVVLVDGVGNEGPVLALADPPFFWAVSLNGLEKGVLYPSQTSNVTVIRAWAVG